MDKKAPSLLKSDQADKVCSTGAASSSEVIPLQEVSEEKTGYKTVDNTRGEVQRKHTILGSRRSSDMKAEQELASFLDSYLYKPLLEEGGFTSIVRIVDVGMQLKGVDIEASTASHVVRIDEKAQLYYINKDLPTFAFELQFLKGERRCIGWFLNDELLTDYYLLIWPRATTENVKNIRKEDFTELDALMISRKKIHSFLDISGLTNDVLLHTAESLRQQGRTGRINTNRRGIYYYVSDSSKYAEAPINLVIRKNYLCQLADAHYKITRSGFERQQNN